MNLKKIILLILCIFSLSLCDGLDDAFESAPIVANYCVDHGNQPKLKLSKINQDTPVIYLSETDSIECSCYSKQSRASFDLPIKPGASLNCSEDSSFYARKSCATKKAQMIPATYKFEIPKEYKIPQNYLDMHGNDFVKKLYKKNFQVFLETGFTCNNAEPYFLEQRFKINITGPCK
ncbi:MAG: hypothetical protein MJY93_02345 [Fibrobacter sp.]|nr:hypothetical protein [Fibrobacter sp.]